MCRVVLDHYIARGLIHFTSLTLVFVSTLALAKTPYSPQGIAGIPDYVINSSFSSLSQGLAYTAESTISTSSAAESATHEFYEVYDPNREYGIDLRFVYDSSKPSELANERKYRKKLDRLMRIQNRLSILGNGYDPDSVRTVFEDGNDKVIRFKFLSHGLPQDIAYLRLLTGYINIRDGELESIVLTNDRPFNHSFKKFDHYHHESRYKKLSSGHYVKTHVDFSFESKGLTGGTEKVVSNLTFLSYEIEGKTVSLSKKPLPNLAANNFETIKVNYDRPLPIWSKEVRKRGYDLPMPYGVMAIWREQTNILDFTSFNIDGIEEAEFLAELFDPDTSRGEVDTQGLAIRADVFVLPFLNVFAVGGNLKADAQLNMAVIPELGEIFELFGGQSTIPIDLALDVEMLGLGITGAMGYKNFFASVTATMATSVTEQAGTSTDTTVLAPMVGYQFPKYRARLLLGGEYQDLNSAMTGSIGDLFEYEIGIETEKWAGVVGVHKELGSSFETAILISTGSQREAFTFNLGYRF